MCGRVTASPTRGRRRRRRGLCGSRRASRPARQRRSGQRCDATWAWIGPLPRDDSCDTVCTRFRLRVVFPSVEFAVFFPVVLALSWALMPHPRAVEAVHRSPPATSSTRPPSPKFCLLLAGVTLGQPGGRRARRPRDAPSARASAIVAVAVALDLRRARRLQVLRLLRRGRSTRCSTRRARRCRCRCSTIALPVGLSLLHLPGDLLRGRRPPRAAASRATTIDVAIYLSLLPAPRRRADRARARVPPAARDAARPARRRRSAPAWC